MRWRNAWQAEGEKGLSPKPIPGRPAKLTDEQKNHLVSLLLKGAMANGYPTELWTTARIAELIHHTFGISYHHAHIGRLMATLQWTYQKPPKPVPERNEEIIAEGTEKTLHGWVPMSSSLIMFILPG